MSNHTPQNDRDCPWCGETIKAKAIVCRYCGRDVSPLGEQAAQTRRVQSNLPTDPHLAARKIAETNSESSAPIMPASLMRGILDASAAADDAERRPIAILFADLSGYTAMIEETDGEEVGELLDEFYRGVRLIAAKYDGLADEFIGDEAMAIFGAPRAHGDDPERAIRAALDIREYVREIGKRRGMKLDTHSGIAYGEVVLRRNHLDNQTIGDATNLAARLRAAARDGEILVDNRIHSQTRTTFDWVDKGEVEIKGKKRPVHVRGVAGARKQFAKVALGERIALAPFAGRAREMQELHEAAAASARGPARTALVLGEAGVGKSRLIYEFYHSLREGEFNWITGRCLAFGSPVPFLPFAELLRAALGFNREEAPDAKGLEAAIGRLARTAGKPKPAELKSVRAALAYLLLPSGQANPLLELDGAERRRRLIDAICAVLRWVCASRPAIAVLEDFHWAGPDSQSLFVEIRRRMAEQPILFLIAGRPPMPAALLAEGVCTSVQLKELNARDSRALLRALLPSVRFPAGLAEKILARAAGNPFYLEELLMELNERGAFAGRVPGQTAHAQIEIPDSVEAIVLARLDRLDQSLKRVLQCAATIGQDFRYALLRRVTQSDEQLESLMTRLIGEDYILQSALAPELIYIFRNIVLRDVAYSTLLIKHRTALHARIAQAIEEIFPDRREEFAEFLAFHFEHGALREKAVEYLRLAADKCERLYAVGAAADYLKRLLKQYDKAVAERSLADARSEKIGVHLRLGDLYRIAGKIEISETNWRRALDAAKALDEKKAALRAMLGLAETLRLAGKSEAALAMAGEALAAARKSKDGVLLAAACNLDGHLERVMGHHEAAERRFEECLGLARSRGDARGQYQALNHLGILSMQNGRCAEAAERFERAHALAGELGLRDEQAQVSLNVGLNRGQAGDMNAAASALTRALREAQRCESERGAQLALLALADLHLKCGEHTRAEKLCAHLRERGEAAPYADIRLVALTNEARAWIALGKLTAARANLDAVFAALKTQELAIALGDAMALDAEWLLACGKNAEALKVAEALVADARKRRDAEWISPAHALASRAHLALGNRAAATRAADKGIEAARANGNKRDEGWAQWALACARNGAALNGKGAARADGNGTAPREAAEELARAVGDRALLAAIARA